MQLYLVKRLFMTVLVLFLVTVLLSLLVHIVPGDPARLLKFAIQTKKRSHLCLIPAGNTQE